MPPSMDEVSGVLLCDQLLTLPSRYPYLYDLPMFDQISRFQIGIHEKRESLIHTQLIISCMNVLLVHVLYLNHHVAK